MSLMEEALFGWVGRQLGVNEELVEFGRQVDGREESVLSGVDALGGAIGWVGGTSDVDRM